MFRGEGLYGEVLEDFVVEDILAQVGRLIDPGNAQALEYVARAEQLLANLERLRAEPDIGSEKE